MYIDLRYPGDLRTVVDLHDDEIIACVRVQRLRQKHFATVGNAEITAIIDIQDRESQVGAGGEARRFDRSDHRVDVRRPANGGLGIEPHGEGLQGPGSQQVRQCEGRTTKCRILDVPENIETIIAIANVLNRKPIVGLGNDVICPTILVQGDIHACAAVNRIVARATFEDIVQIVADDDIGEGVADPFDGGSRQGEIFDIGAKLIINGRNDRIGSPAPNLMNGVAGIVHVIGVIAEAAGHVVRAFAQQEDIGADGPEQRVVFGRAGNDVWNSRSHACNPQVYR